MENEKEEKTETSQLNTVPTPQVCISVLTAYKQQKRHKNTLCVHLID